MKKILIIEDDPIVTGLISESLKNNNYTVVTATSGQDGITKAVEEKPDLILLDLLLPDGYGFDALNRIKEHLELRYIPVIVVSSRNDSQAMLDAVKARADDFLPKPFQEHELLHTIEKYI